VRSVPVSTLPKEAKGGRTMVRMIIALLITAALSVTCGPSKMARPLKAGMPNTITLANGQVVYDLNGDWDALYDVTKFGSNGDIVRITQKGNQFVGIKLIGNTLVGKNEITIRGKLEQNGFKNLEVHDAHDLWQGGWGKISEDGNKMIIRAWVILGEKTITLERK
jgi:hypothetical protein